MLYNYKLIKSLSKYFSLICSGEYPSSLKDLIVFDKSLFAILFPFSSYNNNNNNNNHSINNNNNNNNNDNNNDNNNNNT